MKSLGVIAAGGASRRMGGDKAGVRLEGTRLIDWVYQALRPTVDEVVVAASVELLRGVRTLADPVEAVPGPLAALATGLEAADDESAVLLVAVDQPLVRPATIANLIDLCDGSSAIVPVDAGRRQVTCAVYPSSWRGEAQIEATGARGSLQTLLQRLPCVEVPETEWRTWGEDGRSWFSVDTPELLTTAAGMMRGT